MASTVKQEIAIGRKYAPAIAWPTLFLLAAIYIGLGLSVYFAVTGYLPYWASALVNAVILYATYTVAHDAKHNAVFTDRKYRWVNTLVGHLGTAPLWMLYYPNKASHMVHHQKCNTEEDPDLYARGSFGVVALWRIPVTALGLFNPVVQWRACRQYGVKGGHFAATVLTWLAYASVTLGLIAAGYGVEVLVLWFIPFMVGYSAMLVFFTWIPHYPHTRVGRYVDTRVNLWPGANLLTQGQHAHLIHHMMPWVPWYHYDRCFREIRPFLEQNGATIDQGVFPKAAA